jgi:pantoate--beta-alanine ligase
VAQANSLQEEIFVLPISVAPTVSDLRNIVANWRKEKNGIALVPTMGALHEGHLSLVHLARQRADHVVVSIFVNPTQFAPNEDFSKYPRTFEDDCAKLAGLADLVFAPMIEEMYPPGAATTVVPAGPAMVGLEDRFRPTHFQGVATVVTKLLIQVMPDLAVFGEKDYQQLKVVTRMATDLCLPVEIVPAPTLREPDGLAMSSRNRYLSSEERRIASALFGILTRAAADIRAGRNLNRALDEARSALTDVGFIIDYVEARNAETLAQVEGGFGAAPLRLLAAARLGTTRLIDNVAV